MIKRLFTLFLVFLFLLSSAITTLATTSSKDGKETILQPENGSDVVLSKVEVLKSEENHISVKVSGHKKLNEPSKKFNLELNLDKGTYKTKLIKDDKSAEEDTNVTSFGSYSATVTVVTYDPAYADLARTSQSLWWSVLVDNTVAFSDRSKSVWAANPSAFGTHWFVNQDYWVGSVSYDPGYQSLSSTNYASYYNWDFQDDNQITEAWHQVEIIGLNSGSYDYNYWYDHTGEYANLLSVQVWLS